MSKSLKVENNNFPIGKKVFATYKDDLSHTTIDFIPTYIVEDGENLYIGSKNDMVGTPKGYFPLVFLTGTNQLNAKFLSNIFIKKKG